MASHRRIATTSLSSRIINHLIGQGHSQADIARILGVSQGYVSLVKSRERGLTLDHLEKIAMAEGMNLGAFLTAVTEPAAGLPDPNGRRAALKEALRKGDIVQQAMMRGTSAASR